MNPLFILFVTFIMVHTSTLKIRSTAFTENGNIPAKYTCTGSNINPALTITNVPIQAKSLALIMDDPDAPDGGFVHWVMWNIPVDGKIDENSAPGAEGKNGKMENTYAGPCPPSGTHHYHFKVYALDTRLELTENTDKQSLLKAMENHVVGKGELVGLFKK